jgi:protease-4
VLRRLADQGALPFQSPGVGVVEVRGVITESDDIVDTLKRFRDSESIAAVVMRVESPGGAVGPAQEIYRAVRKLRESKPVVASLGNLAASGGYYIASACHPIVANPGTVTGSIGVIMSVRNVAELVEWAGIRETVIKSVPYKDMANPLRDLAPEEKAILQNMVDDVHAQFVSAVAVGRGMPEAKVREVADGRLYSGAQALGAGLVDELGGYEDAVAIAARAAGLPGEPRTVRARPGRRMWWADWIGGAVGLHAPRWMITGLPDGLQFLYLGAAAPLR